MDLAGLAPGLGPPLIHLLAVAVDNVKAVGEIVAIGEHQPQPGRFDQALATVIDLIADLPLVLMHGDCDRSIGRIDR
ncbi:MAG: hypothetical protein Tsb002_27530 [Wenzhouxiangellaceae bacterium]